MIDKAKILYQIELMEGILKDFKRWVFSIADMPQKSQAELKFSQEQLKPKKYKGRQKNPETIRVEKAILTVLASATERLEPNVIVKQINETQNGKPVEPARVRRLLFRLKKEKKVQAPEEGFWEIVRQNT